MNKYIQKKIAYYKCQISRDKETFVRYRPLIITTAKYWNLNPNILFGILLIENVNRGNKILRFAERIAVVNMPKVIINRDASIGIAQIKISTALKYTKCYTKYDVAKLLLKDCFSIRICSMIINEYFNTATSSSNKILELVNYYTTGKKYTEINDSIYIYYKLLNWIIDSNLIEE